MTATWVGRCAVCGEPTRGASLFWEHESGRSDHQPLTVEMKPVGG